MVSLSRTDLLKLSMRSKILVQWLVTSLKLHVHKIWALILLYCNSRSSGAAIYIHSDDFIIPSLIYIIQHTQHTHTMLYTMLYCIVLYFWCGEYSGVIAYGRPNSESQGTRHNCKCTTALGSLLHACYIVTQRNLWYKEFFWLLRHYAWPKKLFIP